MLIHHKNFFELQVSQSRCSKDEAIGCFQIPLLCMEHHRMKKPNVKCIMPMLTNNHASPVSSTPAGFISSSRKRRRSKFPNSRSHTMRKIEIWFSAFSIKVWMIESYSIALQNLMLRKKNLILNF